MKNPGKMRFLIAFMIVPSFLYSQEHPLVNNIVPFASGLSSPVCIASAGDSRLFIVDQHGYIRIVDNLGNISPTPFLDIHERVNYGGEKGLLGLAFHPQFASNGYFYVNYIGPGDSTHISRFAVGIVNPNLADPFSEFKLMTIPQPFTNHKGGDLHFGPDGYLYIGLGDGGSAGDPGNRSQNLMDYHGKMLRIDVNNGAPYSIPGSNPFIGNPDALGEIWAYGLRNPWRFSFDRAIGDLWIGDVGQNQFEEIDFQPAGTPGGNNYGWRCYEGNQSYNSDGCPAPSTLTFPIYTYPHGDECSITGGYVYRGSTSSPFYGYYFFADYCSDRIWTLHLVEGYWISEEFGQFPGNNFTCFGEDANGQLYIAGLSSGTVYKVIENTTGLPERQSEDLNITQGINGLIHIESGSGTYQHATVNMEDIRGRRVYSGKMDGISIEIYPGELPHGLYILSVETNDKRHLKKIIR